MKIVNIKQYPCELHIKADDSNTYVLNYDGQQGLFTRNEWKDDEVVSLFDDETQEYILDRLEMTTSNNFFAEDTD